MVDSSVPPFNCAHLDHTTVPGGAEFALARILSQPSDNDRSLFVPKIVEDSPYAHLVDANVSVTELSRSDVAVAGTIGRNLIGLARLGISSLSQVLRLAVNPKFRAADILHTNTSRAAIFGAMVSFPTRKPLVIHLRDMTDSASLGRAGFWLFRNVALRRADGIIANSRSTLDSATPFIPDRALRVVIPSAGGMSDKPSSEYVPNEVFRVGMVARLAPWKGQHLLIEAFALRFRDENAVLTLAGGPLFGSEAYEAELRNLAKTLGVGSQVVFLGHVHDVESHIDGFDACVQSSMQPEPLGQNVLQYLSRARATLASGEGGPTEWIESGVNGLLFEPRDPRDLSEKLWKLYTDPKLRSRLAEAAGLTPGLLTDHEVSREHYAFLSRVLSGKKSGISAKRINPEEAPH